MLQLDFLAGLPLFLAIDLLLPFFLAPAYPGYCHLTQVMSVLGNAKAPLHLLYQIWLVLFGVVLFFSCFQIYGIVSQESHLLGLLLASVIALYALGGCILSGFFSVGETKSLKSLSAKIHGYGSVLGFTLLLLAPLFLGLYFLQAAHSLLAIFSLACFGLAVFFFSLFIMADKPQYQGSVIALEGLWQRLSLLCMYLPLAIFCLG